MTDYEEKFYQMGTPINRCVGTKEAMNPEPEYKPIVRAKAISFENQGQPGWEVLDHLGNTVLYRNPEAEAVLSRIGYEKDQLLILKNAAEGDRPVGFVSFRELRSEELFGVLKSMELANAVRRRTSREVLYITGIHAREREIHDGEAIRDPAQLLLAEVITQALEKNCSFAIFAAERGTVSKEAAFALERQGFVRPELLEEGEEEAVSTAQLYKANTVLSPLSGSVQELYASDAQTVSLGTPVLLLRSQEQVLQFSVSQSKRESLYVGQKVRASRRDREYTGTIEDISLEESGQYLVTASLVGANSLSAGMQMDVSVLLCSVTAPCVPLEALDGDQLYCVMEDGLAKVQVKTSLCDAMYMALTMGPPVGTEVALGEVS